MNVEKECGKGALVRRYVSRLSQQPSFIPQKQSGYYMPSICSIAAQERKVEKNMKLAKTLKKIGYYVALGFALINPIVVATALILYKWEKRRKHKGEG